MKIRIIRTGDKRPWTEHKARNIGVRAAKGEYVFLIDVDYVIPEVAIREALLFDGDRLGIRRRIGILDEYGDLWCDDDSLRRAKVKKKWWHRFVPGHRSQFVIRKDLFWDLGGYDEKLDGKDRPRRLDGMLKHVGGGAGQRFWRKWQKAEREGKVVDSSDKLTVFMLPEGRWCHK